MRGLDATEKAKAHVVLYQNSAVGHIAEEIERVYRHRRATGCRGQSREPTRVIMVATDKDDGRREAPPRLMQALREGAGRREQARKVEFGGVLAGEAVRLVIAACDIGDRAKIAHLHEEVKLRFRAPLPLRDHRKGMEDVPVYITEKADLSRLPHTRPSNAVRRYSTAQSAARRRISAGRVR